jgi:hypothetical protein
MKNAINFRDQRTAFEPRLLHTMITPRELKKRLAELTSSSHPSFLDLARDLRILHELDIGEFNRLVRRAKLGPRKAYYLLKIAKQYSHLAHYRSRLQAIGWTKLAILGEHITPRNAARLIKLAEENTVRQLRSLVSDVQPPKTRCVLLYFNPAEYRSFEAAVLRNGGSRRGRGLVGKEQALIKALRQSRPN